MGWLAIIVWIVATVLTWVAFGWVVGVPVLVIGFVVLNKVGPWLDARFGDRSLRFLEFHEAWDFLVGPPQTADDLSAKRLYLAEWRTAARKTGVPALDWLRHKLREPHR